MKRFRRMAMFLVGVMLLAISSSAFAAVKDDTVSPLYLYTRKVTASLSISDGGKATCYGYVRANSSGVVFRSPSHCTDNLANHGAKLQVGVLLALHKFWILRKPSR